MLVTNSGNAQDAIAAHHLNKYLYNDEKPSRSEISDNVDERSITTLMLVEAQAMVLEL